MKEENEANMKDDINWEPVSEVPAMLHTSFAGLFIGMVVMRVAYGGWTWVLLFWVAAAVIYIILAVKTHQVAMKFFYEMKALHRDYHINRGRFEAHWEHEQELRRELMTRYGFPDDLIPEIKPAPSFKELKKQREKET